MGEYVKMVPTLTAKRLQTLRYYFGSRRDAEKAVHIYWVGDPEAVVFAELRELGLVRIASRSDDGADHVITDAGKAALAAAEKGGAS